MTGTDLNISFQDTQYLSELYAKLGSLQYDLANFDMIETEQRLTALAVTICIGIIVGVFICIAVDIFGKHPKRRIIAMVLWGVILTVAYIYISNFVVDFTEHNLLRDIEATEMAIETIKMIIKSKGKKKQEYVKEETSN